MEESKSYFRLGLFVFVTITTLAAVLFILGGRSLFQPTFTFETYFDESVAGLDVGAPVQFRGVPLGEVTEIVNSGLDYEPEVPFGKRRAYIVVRAKVAVSRRQAEQLERELGEYIKRGMRVQTQMAGITGQQYLSLDLFDPQANPPLPFDWVPRDPYVPSAPSLTTEIIANVQEFLASLNKAQIQELGQKLNRLVDDVDQKVGELPVGELSAEASDVLKDGRATIDRIDGILARGDVEVTLRNLSAASGRLDALLAKPEIGRTLTNVVTVTDRLDAVVGDNQYDLRAIVEDLRVTSDNLRVVSEGLKRYPGALVGGPPEKIKRPGEAP